MKLPSVKLTPRWLGPFKILKKTGPNTVKLELPKRLEHVEATQNVAWLKPYKHSPAELGPSTIHPTPDLIDGEIEDEVEVILADRYTGKRKEYLVRFATYGPEDDMWLPLKNLENCKESIEEYWKRQNARR